MSKDVLLDFDELEKEAGNQLQFQEYAVSSPSLMSPVFQSDPVLNNTANEGLGISKESSQLGADPNATAQPSMWTFAFYQRLFDVDTDQVVKRVCSSILPNRGGSFYDSDIKRKPDLYGPFWICVTLVFSTAIAGNLYNYFMTEVSGSGIPWRYDFHKVPYAATAIFGYSWLLPLVLYGLLWWRKAQGDLSFLELLCVYGYSLAIYIPVSLLWLIPVPWFQWTLVIVAAALSGSVLLLTLWPAVSGAEKRIAVILMFAILVFHLTLAAGFLLYFFHVPNLPPSHPTSVSPSALQEASSPKTAPISKRSDNTERIEEIATEVHGAIAAMSAKYENITQVNLLPKVEEKKKENGTVSKIDVPSTSAAKLSSTAVVVSPQSSNASALAQTAS